MKKIAVLIAAALAPVAFVNVAHADQALATAKGCMACHQLDKKVVGPAYNAIPACYAEKDAKKLAAMKADLAKKVKAGCTGKWGQIPMPANAAVADADVAKIVDWIFTLKGGTCPADFKK